MNIILQLVSLACAVPPLAVRCSYRFVEEGSFLDVECMSESEQGISSLIYNLNTGSNVTG